MRVLFPALLVITLACTACHRSAGPVESVKDQPSAAADAGDAFFDPKTHPEASVGAPLDPHQLTPSQLQYGIAPKRDPHVTYAPDVILMEEGDKAIRMAASDGMTWVFDAHAPHVSEFQEGRIVFATGRAVGRIGQLLRNGDTVTVRLAPVQITDVVKEGHFIVTGPLHPQNFIVYTAPDFPSVVDLKAAANKQAIWQGEASDEPHLVRTAYIPVGTPVPAGVPAPLVPMPPAAIDQPTPFNIPQDGISIYPVHGSDTSMGVEFKYDKNGVYMKSDGKLIIGDAHIRFKLDITHGEVRTFGLSLDGMAALALEFEASSAQDHFVNASLLAQPAIDLVIPTPVAGLPLSLTVDTSFLFNTGFSAKTSTLKAKARYSVTGNLFIGKDGDAAGILPKITPKVDVDLANTLDGISVGINSMNLTFHVQPMVGIGAFGFNTGVYIAVDFGGDVVKQSDVVLAHCKAGYMRASTYAGIGYRLPGPLVDFINTLLRSFCKYQIDKQGSFLQEPKPPLVLLQESTNAPPGCARSK